MLFALALTACAEPAEEIETTEKVPVVVQPVRRGAIRGSVRATGIVKPAPGAELLVTAPQSAQILEIPKAEGDAVRKGDLLVRFEIPSLDAERAGRRADQARAKARLANAEAAATRAEGLFDRGIAARKEVEDATRELTDARAAVSEADQATGAAETLGRRGAVMARFDGIIATRWHNPGDIVEAAASDPILRVIDPARLQVEAAVPLAALSRVAVGAPANVFGPDRGTGGGSDPGGSAGAPPGGVVVSLPAAVEPSTGTAVIRVAFTARTSLAAGTPVQVEILTEEHADALIVPASAVIRERTESFLCVMDGEGRTHRRRVEVGIVTAADAEILSGAAEGDRVIVQGQDGLPDGASVTAVTANP